MISKIILSEILNTKINAPTFIYWIINGEYPSSPIYGRQSNHPEKEYNGVMVDKYIPDIALDSLNEINEIEIRSSCQGDSYNLPTFLIFRTKNQKEKYVQSVVNNLNSYNDIKCGYDNGLSGLYRIGVTPIPRMWYTNSKMNIFNNWWINLSKKIRKSI